jgi:enoyl-CoA hydratase
MTTSAQTGAADSALLVEHRGPVLRLTLNRPAQRNALSLALLEELGRTVATHGADPGLKAVVITGNGKCFAAGGARRALEAVRPPDQARAMSRLGRTALDALRRCPVPIIAAVNGPALGGGAELAMACDLRIAAPAGDIGFLQAQLNVTPAWGGGIDLLAAVGHARALEILVAARRIPPAEAQALGLVQQVCGEAQSLEDAVEAFLAPVTRRPVQVLRALKAVSLTSRLALHEQLAAAEEERFVETWIHPDHWSAAERALAPKTPSP